jgi:hypothetical protein
MPTTGQRSDTLTAAFLELLKRVQPQAAAVGSEDLLKQSTLVRQCLNELANAFDQYASETRHDLALVKRTKRPTLLHESEVNCVVFANLLEHLNTQKLGLNPDWVERLENYARNNRDLAPDGLAGIRVWRLRQTASRDLYTTGDVVATGRIREHCCAAILTLIRGVLDFRECSPFHVRSVEADLHGGHVKICLGKSFDGHSTLESFRPLRELHTDLALIVDKLEKHSNALSEMRLQLSASGLPIRAWLLEHKARLYDAKGKPTYEPALSMQYLQRVADAMWTLSTRVFGEGVFSYDELADYVREPVTERVRRAAYRVHCEVTKTTTRHMLWLGRDSWRWLPEKDRPYASIIPEAVATALKGLTPPLTPMDTSKPTPADVGASSS